MEHLGTLSGKMVQMLWKTTQQIVTMLKTELWSSKDPFTYLVKFQLGHTINISGSIEHHLGHQRHPQICCKRFHLPNIQSHSLREPKERLRQVPQELAAVSRTLATNRMWPIVLSRHIFGSPNLTIVKSSSQDRKDKQEGHSYLWKARYEQSVGRQKQILKSQFKDLNLTNVFCQLTRIWNRRDNMKFYLSLEIWVVDFGNSSYSLLISANKSEQKSWRKSNLCKKNNWKGPKFCFLKKVPFKESKAVQICLLLDPVT